MFLLSWYFGCKIKHLTPYLQEICSFLFKKKTNPKRGATSKAPYFCSFLWRREKNEKRHPPSPNMTSSNSVATRDSWSKLHSPLAPPSLLPIWEDLNRRLQKPPIFWSFWYRGTRDDIFNAHFFSKRNEPKKILLSPNPFLHIKGLNWLWQHTPPSSKFWYDSQAFALRVSHVFLWFFGKWESFF